MTDFRKKLSGAFYTSHDVADYLVTRVLQSEPQTILEPSFGDGSFMDAVISKYGSAGWGDRLRSDLHGVELEGCAVTRYADHPLIGPSNLSVGDFLAVEPFPVDLVIGNPPYVGLNKISDASRIRAQRLLDLHEFKMQSSGSLWFPFIMHSCAFLKHNGTIAFVLPFEVTYVRYARQLWKYLGEHFRELTVIRVFEDLFPDVDVETVLLIAEGFGGRTNFVRYEVYDSKRGLFQGLKRRDVNVPIESIVKGQRPFVWSLLDPSHLRVLDSLRATGALRPISDFCKFKIGYVSADQHFFHPAARDVLAFGISCEDLVPAISNAKSLAGGSGLEIVAGEIRDRLFYPRTVTGNHPYIAYGEQLGVNTRFKCRQRKPWYRTPSVEVADIVLSVFGDRPRLFVNAGGYAASNSLLCGFLRGKQVSARELAASWYNSLTLLSIEMKVHSLGGGVLVFVPGEADSLDIVDPRRLGFPPSALTTELDRLLRGDALEAAYREGDARLPAAIGVTRDDIELVQDGVQRLRRWRDSRLRQNTRESERIPLII